MTNPNRSEWTLTPSQQQQFQAIGSKLSSICGRHRPFILSGDIGVGKTFLALRLADDRSAYHNIARDHLVSLLEDCSLSRVTPESLVRFIRRLTQGSEAAVVYVDGIEPLLNLWAVEHAQVVPNFFLALSRAVFDQPLVALVQTSPERLPSGMLGNDAVWPVERHFRLELTQADKAIVATNWGVDPMRGHVSGNLHELLATKLRRWEE